MSQLGKSCHACYGGFNRSNAKGYIRTTSKFGSFKCTITRDDFPVEGVVPLPVHEGHKCNALIFHFGPPQDTKWDGAEYMFDKSRVARVDVDFSIQTECHCGIGHVDVPGVPMDYSEDVVKGTLLLKDHISE